MKKYIIIITLLITSTLYSQLEVDMAGESFNKHYKNGFYYVKDMNNYFSPYLGAWQYIDGNKEFRITLTKVTKYHDIFPNYNIDYFRDCLTIEYQQFENGQLIFSSPQDDYPTGIIKEFGELGMSFTDYNRNNEVFNLDLLLISIPNNPEEYHLRFKISKFETRNTYYDEHPNEPYFSVPNDIIMTKME